MPESPVALLIWMEKSGRTRDDARRRGRDRTAAWVTALGDGLFTVTSDNLLVLTEKGREELALWRMAA